ncbi:hypothetical protein HK105_208880 [Polyrhizophydium stewartii]|uniref:Protein kinase domain-containing protein n=1 Tax=Polyrhizophydium stewartii TaxID=2732419 RepID=A0ABR4MWM3_9FUNG
MNAAALPNVPDSPADRSQASTTRQTREGSFVSGNPLTSIKEAPGGGPSADAASAASSPRKSSLPRGTNLDDKMPPVHPVPAAAGNSQSARSRESMQSMANLAAANTGGGSNGSIEKPTLLLYPRKSVVSGSPRDLSQVRSSIHGIAEAVAHTAGFSAPTKTSRESMAGSRASLLMRSLNRGANSGSIAHLAAESRRSMLQIAQDGQVMVTRQQLGASGLPRSHSQNILHHSNQRMSQPPPQQHQPPSQAVQKQLQDAQQSLEPMPVGRRSRPVSIVSLKNLNKIKESLSNLASAAHNEELEQQEQSMPVVEGQQVASNEYYEYLMLTQRHSSSNFIHKVDSTEIAWETKPLPLKMVGAYLLGEKIGKGAFGKVKEGVCSETLKRVAIKIIGRKRLRKVPNGVENMIREIKMLRRLKHPNVVTLVDVFAKVEDQDGNVGIFPWFTTIEEEPIVWLYDDGREEEKDVKVLKWYLILEFCPCSLQVLLEQCDDHKISLAQAHRYFVQLMDGLSYLHSQSIIHRDIKPGNMLITSDGVLKISDFGVAEQFDVYSGQAMQSEAFAGTHQFLSPEIAEVDVWACGVTLYNMISGRLPFEFDDDGNLLDLYDKIIRGTFEMPAEATPDLADLLRRMLAKDPALRLSVFEIQSHPWTQTVYNMPRKAPYIPTFQQHGPDTPLSPETHRDGASTIESSPAKATTAPRSTDEPGPERHSGASAGEKADAGSNSTPAAAAPPAVDVTAPTTEAAVTPCETTMIPFLNIMYQSEIEADLRETGTVFDGLPDDTIAGSSTSIGKRKHKFVGWIKHVFGSKSAISPTK